MKKGILFVLFASILTIEAQIDTITITGSRFTYDIFNQWVEKYKEIQPNVFIQIKKRGSFDEQKADLVINAHDLTKEEIGLNNLNVNLFRYVILPVANSKSEIAQNLAKNGLSEKEVRKLFFEKWDLFEESEKKNKKSKFDGLNIYTREQTACAPTTFAKYYDHIQRDFKGKGIAGDDKHLVEAVLRDDNGVTYNHAGGIYDIKTRKVKEGLIVLPSDQVIKKNANTYDNLDNLTAFANNYDGKGLVTGNVNLLIRQQNENKIAVLNRFVTWILNTGYQDLNKFGFVELEKSSFVVEKQKVNTNDN